MKDYEILSVMHDGGPPPPLVIMSMSVRITAIPKSQENQITMIGWLVHNNYHTDRAAPSPQFTDQFCGNLKCYFLVLWGFFFGMK